MIPAGEYFLLANCVTYVHIPCSEDQPVAVKPELSGEQVMEHYTQTIMGNGEWIRCDYEIPPSKILRLNKLQARASGNVSVKVDSRFCHIEEFYVDKNGNYTALDGGVDICGEDALKIRVTNLSPEPVDIYVRFEGVLESI